jgi:hypothetical protein
VLQLLDVAMTQRGAPSAASTALWPVTVTKWTARVVSTKQVFRTGITVILQRSDNALKLDTVTPDLRTQCVNQDLACFVPVCLEIALLDRRVWTAPHSYCHSAR